MIYQKIETEYYPIFFSINQQQDIKMTPFRHIHKDIPATQRKLWVEPIIKQFEIVEGWVINQFMGAVKTLSHLHFNGSDAFYLSETFKIYAVYWFINKSTHAGEEFDVKATTTGIELKCADKILFAVSIENKNDDKPLKMFGDMTDEEQTETFSKMIDELNQKKKKTRRGGKKHKKRV
jgi:hypothetical protein